MNLRPAHLRWTHLRRLVTLLVALTLVAAACDSGDGDGDGDGDAEGGAGGATATVQLTAGECTDGGVTSGTYFRMANPDGTVDEGPYTENGDSPCGDLTFTPLTPGSDGGLVVGDYQPNPEPAFDENGNALAAAIVQPATFFGVDFSVATNPTDPQTGDSTAVPTLAVASDGTVSGDLSAFAASWNEQHFNQGAPKPDGSTPGETTPPTGTFDEATGEIVVEWTSRIVGGPFDNFTGIWHVEGTVEGELPSA